MSRQRPFVFVFLVTLILILGYAAGCATGGQPHMQAALDELRGARSELEAAVSDKGGHRVRAIELVDEAIGEVKAGIEFAAH
jgi:hypothetical protein